MGVAWGKGFPHSATVQSVAFLGLPESGRFERTQLRAFGGCTRGVQNAMDLLQYSPIVISVKHDNRSMKVTLMRCKQCPSGGLRRSSISNNLLQYAQRFCCKAPLSKDFAPTCGCSSAWGLSSDACTTCALARRRSGAS